MTVAEIKLESLKLMFVDFVTDYDIDDLVELSSDESCRDYLANMPGAINRCFSALEAKGAVPAVSRALPYDESLVRFGRIRYSASEHLPDCQRLERIVREDADGGYEGQCEYRREGDTIVLPAPRLRDGEAVEAYSAVYRPRLERISNSSNDHEELKLPEHIAALIPYYVKGDLFRMDEPDEAAEARNYFESALSEMIIEEEGIQGSVVTVYSEDC